ncbi:hypothetical protein K3495_g8220 [Podosphaera aphanis]|nr:hypothetical protein K3495_g8220 [Podosphaera aphanis]
MWKNASRRRFFDDYKTLYEKPAIVTRKNEQSNHSINGMTLLMKLIPEADLHK